WVSSGIPPKIVPRVLDMTTNAAKTLLTNHGFECKIETMAPTRGQPAGTVIMQEPGPGEEGMEGDVVTIFVCQP
ncbi:MAG: PASTA domain-containing protein, partial [Clostridia bacterium]|nr:PASTA domain-containing protein [Clostridia bacterium]